VRGASPDGHRARRGPGAVRALRRREEAGGDRLRPLAAAALDPRTTWVLVELGRAGRTIVTATHELEIVPLIADRAVVLGETGHLLADGPAAGVLAGRDLLVEADLIHDRLHRLGLDGRPR
jgi:ABC-type cobalamin transport system ATPase subunit